MEITQGAAEDVAKTLVEGGTDIFVYYELSGGARGLADFESKAELDKWLESNYEINVLRVFRGWEKQIKRKIVFV